MRSRPWGEYQGKRYGVPNGTDGRVIFFNKKLFAQAGLPADWQPASWQDVYDAAAKLKALPGVTPVQWDGGVPMGEATTIQGFLPLLAGAGGTLWADGKWIKPGKAFTDALGFYQKIYGGGLGDPVLQEDAKGRDKSFAEFAANKIGIYAESDYMWRSVVNPAGGTAPMAGRNTDVGYALIPSQTPGSGVRGLSFVSYSGGSDWSINPKTKYPQAAWDFLAFMNSKAETESRIGGAAKITARTDVNTEVLATDPMLKFVNDKVLPITTFRPSQAAYNDVSSLVQKAVADVVGGKSPADAAAAYEKALEGLVGASDVTAGQADSGDPAGLGRARAAAIAAPALLVVAAFLVFPALWTLYLGTTNYRLTGFAARHPHSVGLQNYTNVVQDPGFHHSLWLTFEYVILSAVSARPCWASPSPGCCATPPAGSSGSSRRWCCWPGSCRARWWRSCGWRCWTATPAR